MSAASTRFARLATAILIIGAVLGGCATQPHPAPRTTVVLLPDDDGKVGAVTVSSTSGSEPLNGGFTFTSVESANAAPLKSGTVDRAALNREYGELIRLQAPMPLTFTLYFLLDKTELTEESKSQLPAVQAAVRERKPTSITVFGHADATGSSTRNMKLSAERAEAAANLLRAGDSSLGDIELQFFGDRKPLVSPGAGASEARNRRVEILAY